MFYDFPKRSLSFLTLSFLTFSLHILYDIRTSSQIHCLKSVQILNTGKYGPEITPYLDAFHAVINAVKLFKLYAYCDHTS